MNWLLLATKYLLSFRKGEWSLDDYPVRVQRQTAFTEMPGFRPWRAQILNWWLVGLGESPEEALEELRRNLEARRAEGPLPRPGTRPPLPVTPGDEIGRHGEFAYDFVERVVGVRPSFMSDLSTLGDFEIVIEDDELHRKAALLYGIDTRDLLAEPLWKVLDLVREKG